MPKLVVPQYGQHIVLLGATGSGKTYLANTLLDYYDKYFLIDTQDGLEKEGKVVREPGRLSWYLRLYDRIRYVPKPEYLSSADFNVVFKNILESSTKKKKRERIVYIDEIYHIGYGAGFPVWLAKSITTARQRGLSYWICAQRPRNIPTPVMSEASRIYVFYLNKEDDIKYVASFARTDKKKLEVALYDQQDDFSFIEIDARKGVWRKLPPIKTR